MGRKHPHLDCQELRLRRQRLTERRCAVTENLCWTSRAAAHVVLSPRATSSPLLHEPKPRYPRACGNSPLREVVAARAVEILLLSTAREGAVAYPAQRNRPQ